MGMTELARHHPRRGSISVGIRVGAPAEPRQGFHHSFPATHNTPATKNGIRKEDDGVTESAAHAVVEELHIRFGLEAFGY